MPTKYYKVHGGRLTLREYWKMAPDPFTFLLCAGLKVFGLMSFDFSVPRVEELHYLDEAEVPKAAMKKIKGSIKRLTDAGFELKFYHEMPMLEDHRLGLAAVLVAPDRKTFAMVLYGREKDQEQTHVSCVSRFADGTFGATTTQKENMKPDPENKVARYPGAAADELYDRHADHLQEWEDEGQRVKKLDDATLVAAVLEGEQRHVDYHVERGVIVPMTKAEIRRIREANEEED
jgi:hypothetical protein